jgi:hypothetical protein
MDQVIGQINVIGDILQAIFIQKISFYDTDIGGIIFVVKPAFIPYATNHLMPLLEQNGQQSLGDVSGHSG